MRRLAPLLAIAGLGAALAVPASADAATVAQVVGSSRCIGGPGTATAVSAPAADGTSTVGFTLSGVPDGSWTGGVGIGSASNPSAGITPAAQAVTGGRFSSSATSPLAWNAGMGIGAYALGNRELCEALAAQQGTVSIAGTLNVVLAVHDARKFAADVILSRVAKGHRIKVAFVVKAGRTQRRTVVVTVKRSSQSVPIKGLKQFKPFTSASVVITDLNTRRKEQVSLRRVLG